MKFLIQSAFCGALLLDEANAWGNPFSPSSVPLASLKDHGFGHSLNRETKMILGQFIMSENGRYKVEIDDANLVLSDGDDECWSTGVAHHAVGW